MHATFDSLRRIGNSALVARLNEVVARDRASTAEVVAHIAEMDRRRLYLAAGYSSMHRYCLDVLHLAEYAAFKRIRAGRAARRFPQVLELLADGRLHLTAIVELYPRLTAANANELFTAATHKTREQVLRLLAERFPRADVPAQIVPFAAASGIRQELAPGPVEFLAIAAQPTESNAASTKPAPISIAAPPPRVTPLAPERFALQVTISKNAHELLRRAQELLGHPVPSGNIAEVLERALQELVTRLEKQKLAETDHPGAARAPQRGSRHVPAAVRREVRRRDDDQCTFVGRDGHRCQERRRLEFDHVVPVARGGRSTAANVRLLCRAHNQYEAEQVYGERFMDRKRPAPN